MSRVFGREKPWFPMDAPEAPSGSGADRRPASRTDCESRPLGAAVCRSPHPDEVVGEAVEAGGAVYEGNVARGNDRERARVLVEQAVLLGHDLP